MTLLLVTSARAPVASIFIAKCVTALVLSLRGVAKRAAPSGFREVSRPSGGAMIKNGRRKPGGFGQGGKGQTGPLIGKDSLSAICDFKGAGERQRAGEVRIRLSFTQRLHSRFFGTFFFPFRAASPLLSTSFLPSTRSLCIFGGSTSRQYFREFRRYIKPREEKSPSTVAQFTRKTHQLYQIFFYQ